MTQLGRVKGHRSNIPNFVVGATWPLLSPLPTWWEFPAPSVPPADPIKFNGYRLDISGKEGEGREGKDSRRELDLGQLVIRLEVASCHIESPGGQLSPERND